MTRRDRARDVLMTPGPQGTVLLAGRELFLGGIKELIELIATLLPTREVHTVITPNVDQVLTMRTAEPLGLAYDEASVRITDGFPLVVLGRRLGARRLERLTGADLLPVASRVAGERGWRIAVTGGGPAPGPGSPGPGTHRAAATVRAGGSTQATSPRSRTTSATAVNARAMIPRKGCTGANQVIAPE